MNYKDFHHNYLDRPSIALKFIYLIHKLLKYGREDDGRLANSIDNHCLWCRSHSHDISDYYSEFRDVIVLSFHS